MGSSFSPTVINTSLPRTITAKLSSLKEATYSVFNFNPAQDYEGLEIGVPKPGKYVCVLDTDEGQFGGRDRVDKGTEHFTTPEKIESWVRTRTRKSERVLMKVLSCSRTARVYRRVDESEFMNSHPDAAAVASKNGFERELEKKKCFSYFKNDIISLSAL